MMNDVEAIKKENELLRMQNTAAVLAIERAKLLIETAPLEHQGHRLAAKVLFDASHQINNINLKFSR